MRLPVRSVLPLLLAALLSSSLAVAGPAAAQKRMGRRAESEQVVVGVIQGGPVPAAVSRLRYLGEEPYAAEVINEALRRVMDERPRRNLAAVLAGLETRAAEPTLARLAGDDDSTVRMYAAQGLGRLKSRNVQVLLPLLDDKSSGVRRDAAKALGAARNPKVGRVLIAAAKQEQELEVRAAMLTAVGDSGDAKQGKALKEFLAGDSEGTRFAAARGLCRLGAPEGFAFAGKLLASEDRFVRRQGLELYEGVSAKKSAPALKPLLDDKDRSLAAGAARILYQGGDATMLDWLVVSSWNANTSDKLAYEKELETLQLQDDRRKAILRRAGVAK
ncbi:HEAT repeat domain-containing protein [Myxococcus sp. K15C18031901]|uniref:HEAT repeat domain-containing protein n=1 Tax=Myxococcus dinghuensis TaxID=2906761 RepID=UPI0020A7147A|nr:HEAT repeat domain-containing protein [Myxococcus dinghuensis]MCP3098633.1 HEAT repeat domain-containing protein [Myxococcus dinghuensis]